MHNAQLLVDAYKKNEQQVTEQLEGLLDAEVGETLTTEEKETLDAFHRAFTWDVEYDFTSWWNAEINYDIESSQSTKSQGCQSRIRTIVQTTFRRKKKRSKIPSVKTPII